MAGKQEKDGVIVANAEMKARVERLYGQFATMAATTSRVLLQNRLGKSYDGDRDLFEALGYDKVIRFEDYEARYTRNGVAKRVVNAMPNATWRGTPIVFETEDPEKTPFEADWGRLVKRLKVFHYLKRVDKLAGIGKYAILVLGVNDGKDLGQELELAEKNKLIYLQPYSQGRISIKKYETDRNSPRWGYPLEYIVVQDTEKEVPVVGSRDRDTALKELPDVPVHWSRVIHVADDCLESDTFGTPRLEDVWNYLENLDRVGLSSAEMFWRGAYHGIAFEMDPSIKLSSTQVDDLEEEIEDYMHNMQRYLRLQGVKANVLAPAIASPKEHLDAQLRLIAVSKGWPRRILEGTERGELASQMDERAWLATVDERRVDFAEPRILGAFINHCLNFGLLVPPAGRTEDEEGFTVKWPKLDTLSAIEHAQVAELESKTLRWYAQASEQPMSRLISPKEFMVEVMGWSRERVAAIAKAVEELPPDMKKLGSLEEGKGDE